MNDLIRKLASSFDSQIIYARAKDGISVEFFENKKDFTGLQIMFMYWLELYNGLYGSISENSNYLNDAVIQDDTRCDAYLKYRIKLQEETERQKEYNNNNKVNNNKKNKKTVMIPGLSVCMRQKG